MECVGLVKITVQRRILLIWFNYEVCDSYGEARDLVSIFK